MTHYSAVAAQMMETAAKSQRSNRGHADRCFANKQRCTQLDFRCPQVGRKFLWRLRRTGLAAMVTVYGARSLAEPMIARVRRMHDMVAGTTLSGEPYRANDPELLNWVYATAAYGFVQAYHTYVQPLSSLERDRYYAEGTAVAVLYGATSAPRSEADLELLFEARPVD
jgi:uncharacterized protein (DUF2236 family)